MAAGETRPTHAAPSTMPYISVDALVGAGPVAPPPTLADGGRVSENASEIGALHLRMSTRTRSALRGARKLHRRARARAQHPRGRLSRLRRATQRPRQVRAPRVPAPRRKPSSSSSAPAVVNHGFEQGAGIQHQVHGPVQLAGTVLELGGSEHLRTLDEMQRNGELGCLRLPRSSRAPTPAGGSDGEVGPGRGRVPAAHAPRRRVQKEPDLAGSDGV